MLEEDYIVQFKIAAYGQALSVGTLINLWIDDPAFRRFYNELLASQPFSAFFWEHPPITAELLDVPYEFVLVKSNTLNTIQANPNAFKPHFKSNLPVVTFMNLGKDAKLIAPCPLRINETYTHLGSFTRNAPPQQIDAFWRSVGLQYKEIIGSAPIWLSTSGLGAYWLHVRLDSRPKYYKHVAYK